MFLLETPAGSDASLKIAGVAISLKPESRSVVYLTPALLGFGWATPPYAPASK